MFPMNLVVGSLVYLCLYTRGYTKLRAYIIAGVGIGGVQILIVTIGNLYLGTNVGFLEGGWFATVFASTLVIISTLVGGFVFWGAGVRTRQFTDKSLTGSNYT